MNMDGENMTEKITISFPRSLLLSSPGMREDGKKRDPGNEVEIIIKKIDLCIDFWGRRVGDVGRGRMNVKRY